MRSLKEIQAITQQAFRRVSCSSAMDRVAVQKDPLHIRVNYYLVAASHSSKDTTHVHFRFNLGYTEMWIGMRGLENRVDPGKLDNMVAGGLPAGLSLEENVVKEAEEEASVPEELARQARPAGAVSYIMEVPDGLRRDVLFVYDLRVPADFRPASQDGEHTSFSLVSAAQALRVVEKTDEFKFNVNLVIIDFAIRHGILKPEHRDYLKLLHGLQTWE